MEHPDYLPFVTAFEQLLERGRALPALPQTVPVLPAVAQDAPVCLLFSPHPDDEVITGGLPWRLRRQDGWRVVNVAVTLGSNVGRRAARWSELEQCCARLGFELLSASGEHRTGLERINPQAPAREPGHWAHAVQRIADILLQFQPQAVLCPHDNDGHAAHTGTHQLVMDALRSVGERVQPHVLLTEYWNTQPSPGLMVQLSAQDVAQLVGALSLHAGEVSRNPYHLTLPAGCIDAARRGAERVGAPGAQTPGFTFATLYGWQRWQGAGMLTQAPRLLPLDTPPGLLLG